MSVCEVMNNQELTINRRDLKYMEKYKVVRLFEDNTFEHEEPFLNEYKDVIDFEIRPSFTEEEVINNAADADIIIVGYEPVTKKVLENLPNLKFVTYRSIGFNTIDLAYANEINLPVANITQYCIHEVADYVAAAILMHNRRLLDFNKSVKEDKQWDYELFPHMRRLSAQTVGFIGFGNIAQLTAQRLQAFGAKMIAYDPYLDEEVFEKLGIESVTLEEIFTASDYISSHLPLNPETENTINKDLFALTTKEPVFVNSSRGGVVDEADLKDALANGQLSYAILDVLHDEYPDLDNLPFIEIDNVVLTPHIAFYSLEAFIQSAEDSLRNVINFIHKKYDQVELVNQNSIDLTQEKDQRNCQQVESAL